MIDARGALLEAMARAHCERTLECDPDEMLPHSRQPVWTLYVEEMEPLLDAVISAEASLRTLAPMLARITGEHA